MTDNLASADWSAPGAFEVSPQIYRIPLPMPNDGLRAVNVYAVEADAGLLMIDGGWSITESRDALERALATVGHKVADIHRFVVTHIHRDHYTQAIAIRREFGARVAVGVHERESLEIAASNQGQAESVRQSLRRAGAAELLEPLAATGFGGNHRDPDWEFPDDWLRAGDPIAITSGRHLEVVHTPGHTKGHVVFVDAQRDLLFTGDHVLPHITPSIGFEPTAVSLPLLDYLNSLASVRAMSDMTMLPAHGMPAPSVHARVDELIRHHEERLAMCLAAIGPGGASAYDVARALRWTRRGRSFAQLDPLNQMLAVSETLAHLDVLVHDGRLACETAGAVRVYHL